MVPQQDKNWKLKLRYGRLDTPYHHYTLIVDGEIKEETERNGTAAGPAIMGFKCWASSHEKASEMAALLASELSFSITGRIQLYETDPEEPPRRSPYGYSVKFTPYS